LHFTTIRFPSCSFQTCVNTVPFRICNSSPSPTENKQTVVMQLTLFVLQYIATTPIPDGSWMSSSCCWSISLAYFDLV